MSLSKRLIENIEISASEHQAKHPDCHWYQCLDAATIQLTKRHFTELHPFFQQDLLRTPADLERATKKVAREIQKENPGYSYSKARTIAAKQFGIDNHEDIKEISSIPNDIRIENTTFLDRISGRKMAGTVMEYLSLPELSTIEFSDSEETIIEIEQFDYIFVPIEACEKHGIIPTTVINNEACLPLVVIDIEGIKTDFQMPIEATDYIIDETRKPDFFDSQYCLRFSSKGVKIGVKHIL